MEIADTKGTQMDYGEQARMDAHRLRAESDVIVVSANTVRLDNPNLTVRNWQSAINPKSKS
jgi:riboflavin biosynthesis pyrimidine reductase